METEKKTEEVKEEKEITNDDIDKLDKEVQEDENKKLEQLKNQTKEETKEEIRKEMEAEQAKKTEAERIKSIEEEYATIQAKQQEWEAERETLQKELDEAKSQRKGLVDNSNPSQTTEEMTQEEMIEKLDELPLGEDHKIAILRKSLGA
jgi:hypothetical protein